MAPISSASSSRSSRVAFCPRIWAVIVDRGVDHQHIENLWPWWFSMLYDAVWCCAITVRWIHDFHLRIILAYCCILFQCFNVRRFHDFPPLSTTFHHFPRLSTTFHDFPRLSTTSIMTSVATCPWLSWLSWLDSIWCFKAPEAPEAPRGPDACAIIKLRNFSTSTAISSQNLWRRSNDEATTKQRAKRQPAVPCRLRSSRCASCCLRTPGAKVTKASQKVMRSEKFGEVLGAVLLKGPKQFSKHKSSREANVWKENMENNSNLNGIRFETPWLWCCDAVMLCLLIPRKSRKSPQGHGGFAFDCGERIQKGNESERRFLASTNLNNH